VELQRRLIARGFLAGEADGKIGAQSQAAIKEAERRLGMPETGRAGQKIFRALAGQ
jgi:peptidoglycan hydrolase-like protein with peptidoglycan-binding domain